MAATLNAQELSWLEKFRAEAVKFRDAMLRLDSLKSYAQLRPELKAEHDALTARGQMIKATVETITRTVDQVTGFFSDAWSGASGAVKRFFGLGLLPPTNLGALPLIPIAAISGAMVYMGKYVSDVYLFERRATEQQRLEAKGLTPQEAAAIVSQTANTGDGGGLLDDVLGDLKTPIILGGAAWLFFTVILPAMQSRRGS